MVVNEEQREESDGEDGGDEEPRGGAGHVEGVAEAGAFGNEESGVGGIEVEEAGFPAGGIGDVSGGGEVGMAVGLDNYIYEEGEEGEDEGGESGGQVVRGIGQEREQAGGGEDETD